MDRTKDGYLEILPANEIRFDCELPAPTPCDVCPSLAPPGASESSPPSDRRGLGLEAFRRRQKLRVRLMGGTAAGLERAYPDRMTESF
jgi:hypothetical protein